MKIAAIDIGSNAIRLAIARPLQTNTKYPEFKTVEFTRLPLRLGDDVFKLKIISKKKLDLLEKAMKAFAYLMEIYNVDHYRACATSAMRDAENAAEIIALIKKNTGIKIEVITGKQESKLIQKAVLSVVSAKTDFMHIDIGGGSTEIALLKNGKVKHYESFDIGTVRAREGKISKLEKTRMLNWLSEIMSLQTTNIKAIGTGGNIVKINQLSGVQNLEYNSITMLQNTVNMIKSLSLHDRVYELKLNPDRADVIDFAGEIMLDILNQCNIHQIMTPNIGLKDGIILNGWQSKFQKM